MATEQELIQAISKIENLETLREIFGAIAIALRAKGINQNPIYPEEFPGLIRRIESGINTDDATATSADLLKNKTAYARGEKLIGTLELGSDTSSATATPSDIRKGQTAFGPNGKITGTMPDAGSISGQLGTTSGAEWSSSDPNRGSGTVSITNVNQTAGYTNGYSNGSLSVSVPANRLLKGRTITPTTSEQSVGEAEDILYGAIKVAGASTLIPSNIKKGVSIFNITGTMESGIDTSDGTATADDIAYGKTAYVDGSKVIGRIQVIPKGIATPFTRTSNYDLSFYSSTILIRTLDNGAKKILEVGAGVEFDVPADRFGDATADDVAAGKTFTSTSGLRIMGTGSTAKMSRDVITRSTSTASLSFTFSSMSDRNFTNIFLYPRSNIINSSSGVVTFVILERGQIGDFIVGLRGVCLSNGNYLSRTTGMEISISGTTITLTNTDGYIFSSGDWFVIGTPYVQATLT